MKIINGDSLKILKTLDLMQAINKTMEKETKN